MSRLPHYRPLAHPAPLDPDKPGDRERWQRENARWWENWEHNFTLSLKLVLAVTLFLIALIIIGGIIATIFNG
jgi:uncharacterized protein HemX